MSFARLALNVSRPVVAMEPALSTTTTSSDTSTTGNRPAMDLVEMGSGEQALSAVVALEGALFNGNCLQLYVTPYVSTNS